jgi:hypothetical protein
VVIESQERSEASQEVSEESIGYPEAAAQAAGTGAAGMAPYLLKVLAVMLLLYVAPLFIARSDFYERHSLSFYSRPLNYAYHTAGQNADVILFGDSTALLGIDPSQMSSALGVKVLNLPNTHGSLIVNDDMALRHYLAGNRPPKLIVFYFAPWDFDYGHVPFEATPVYEGEELLMRQGSAQQILAFVAKHPGEGLNFPLRFYDDSWQFALHKVSHQGQEQRLAETHGHIDNTDFSVLPDACTFPPVLLDHVRFDWVKALGEKYSSMGIQVVNFVAPVPSCSNVSALLNNPYAELPAAPPVQLPPGTFVRDIRYIHPHPNAVPQITRNLTVVVRAALARSSQR